MTDLSSKNMFHRMSIESSRGNGSSPLMVDLVDVFVDESVVEQSVAIVEPCVMAQHGHKHMQQACAQVRQLSDVPPSCPLAPQTVAGISRQGTKHYLWLQNGKRLNIMNYHISPG